MWCPWNSPTSTLRLLRQFLRQYDDPGHQATKDTDDIIWDYTSRYEAERVHYLALSSMCSITFPI